MPGILTDSQCQTVDQTEADSHSVLAPLAARVRVVLVGTTHPGNIGSAARAMKAMGLRQLHLVTPERFPDDEATALAVGAADLLASATVHATLAAALRGVEVIYATSARDRRIDWPTFTPRSAAADIVARDEAQVAVVFGPERSGLSNSDLDLCQRLIEIPTVPDFSSLNLAQAVQIIAYELYAAAPLVVAAPRRNRRLSDQAASAADVADLQRHCMRAMAAVEFFEPSKPKLLDRRLRRLLSRAELRDSEVQILRGFLTAVEESLEKARNQASVPL
jgi:tRNA (cytidine32/uridine32-2'-O)-methyltransferase